MREEAVAAVTAANFAAQMTQSKAATTIEGVRSHAEAAIIAARSDAQAKVNEAEARVSEIKRLADQRISEAVRLAEQAQEEVRQVKETTALREEQMTKEFQEMQRQNQQMMKEFQQFRENQPVGPKASIAAEPAKVTETDANSIQHLISQGIAQGFQMLLPAIAKLGQSSPPEKPASRARSFSRKMASKGQGGQSKERFQTDENRVRKFFLEDSSDNKNRTFLLHARICKESSIQKPLDKDPDGIQYEDEKSPLAVALEALGCPISLPERVLPRFHSEAEALYLRNRDRAPNKDKEGESRDEDDDYYEEEEEEDEAFADNNTVCEYCLGIATVPFAQC